MNLHFSFVAPGDESPLLDKQLQAGLRGDFNLGFKIANELEQKFPQSHRAAFNRAWYKMMQGQLFEGLKCLDRGRWIGVLGDPPLQTSKTIYRGENLQNKKLLLCSEGGLGDEMINVRFAENFANKGAHVTVACNPSLASVFARVRGVAAVTHRSAAPFVYHDFWVPGMSAARVLEMEYSDLTGEAYLSVSEEHRLKWSQILNEKYNGEIPRIGLRFYGNPKFEHEQYRKFLAQDLIDAVEGRAWINLQKEETDLPIETWEDTLAVIEHLDLVITSCTSVAHASAALGKPTWIIVPILPYYIWALPGELSPWYRSVRLFRQTEFGLWGDVFERLRFALTDRFRDSDRFAK